MAGRAAVGAVLLAAGCSLGGGGPDPEDAARAVVADVEATLAAVDPTRTTPAEVETNALACGGFDGLQDSQQETEVGAVGPATPDVDRIEQAVAAATSVLEDEGWEVTVDDRDRRDDAVQRMFRGPDDASLTIEAELELPLQVTAITGCFDV